MLASSVNGTRMHRPFLTKLIEWIPQTVALRSGIKIRLRGRPDAKHFWTMFTSPEYMAFVPELASIKEPDLVVIDCGAAIGLFSLLIEHLRRLEILDWPNVSYVLVEPSSFNLRRLRHNIAANLPVESFEIFDGLIGPRSGPSEFYQSRWGRWTSSVFRQSVPMERKAQKPSVDISNILRSGPCLLKVDIEGAEFQLLETYRDELTNVIAIVVEWHAECGDTEKAASALSSTGFWMAKRRLPGPGLMVDLYLRSRD